MNFYWRKNSPNSIRIRNKRFWTTIDKIHCRNWKKTYGVEFVNLNASSKPFIDFLALRAFELCVKIFRFYTTLLKFLKFVFQGKRIIFLCRMNFSEYFPRMFSSFVRIPSLLFLNVALKFSSSLFIYFYFSISKCNSTPGCHPLMVYFFKNRSKLNILHQHLRSYVRS